MLSPYQFSVTNAGPFTIAIRQRLHSQHSSNHLTVLIDTICRSSFLTLPARPDFKSADCTRFQECLEKLPSNPDPVTKRLSTRVSGNYQALSWVRLKWQLPRVARDPTHGHLSRLLSRMKYAWRTAWGSGRKPGTPLSKPTSTVFRDRWPTGCRIGGTTNGVPRLKTLIPRINRYGGWRNVWWKYLLHHPSPTRSHRVVLLSPTAKAEALADSLEARFQPVTMPSEPATIEMADVALRAYPFAPASQPMLTKPDEVEEAIRGIKVGEAPGPDGVPNRALKHLPLWSISLLVTLFSAILTIQYFPAEWTHASLLHSEAGKVPGLPSSYRPIRLLRHDWQVVWKDPTR